jgi:agmatinase
MRMLTGIPAHAQHLSEIETEELIDFEDTDWRDGGRFVSDHEFFVSQLNVFGGLQKSFEEASYAVLGVPFDVTSTYRTGARFGPTAIRQASLNIETFSIRTGIDFEDISVHDLGDLHVSASTEKTLDLLESVTKSLVQNGKTPVTIGGEHTITLGIARALGTQAKKTAIVSFDAHLDLRNEYMGLKVSHTTFLRRINESVKPARIFEIGTRAVCKEELAYAKKEGIEFLTTQKIQEQGKKQTLNWIRKKLEGYRSIYLSIDMDILDPAYAPAAQNPEPNGLQMSILLDMLGAACDDRMIGFDVLEIAPNYDQGISAIQAARVIFELLCLHVKSKKTTGR